MQVPAGTKELRERLLVAIETVSLEHRPKFFTKRSRARMVPLIPNRSDVGIDAGDCDAECAP